MAAVLSSRRHDFRSRSLPMTTMPPRFARLLRLPLLAPLLTFPLVLTSCAALNGAPAELLRLEVLSRSPAFGGASFGEAGKYETIVAVAHLRLDPAHPANRAIADIGRAPTVRGAVEYRSDVVILRPVDGAKASRVLVVDLPNRGNKLFPVMANQGSDQLEARADAGIGHLMERGHTLAWIGWQGDVPLARDGKRVGASLPPVLEQGKPVSGWSYAETVFDDIKPRGSIALAYPPASTSQAGATLTVRAHARAAPQTIPASQWRFDGNSAIEVERPKGYDAGAIYRFEYQATGARVMGLGLAAIRDAGAWLKAGEGAGHPLADIKPAVAIAVGVSQSGRVLRDFIWQGFNADLNGKPVFDGAMPLIAGSRKSFLNVRFAQPGRNATQHLDHFTYGDQFPFSYDVIRDPISGKTDGIYYRCSATRTCPKLMHVDSSLEFWQGRASLVVTDGAGRDIALPDNVRAYLLSSTQHMAADRPTVGICKYPSNPAPQGPAVRALFERLVTWARDGRAPPPSRYPTLKDARLVVPQRDAVGFPDLSKIGIGFPEVVNELVYVDYSATPGVPSFAKRYQVLVPMADADGMDLAGIRLPDVAVPLATYTGWNLRRQVFAENQLCGLNGMHAPLPATPRAGDPRRAISQRYASRLEYAKSVALVARELRDQGYLLADDANRYIERARADVRVAP